MTDLTHLQTSRLIWLANNRLPKPPLALVRALQKDFAELYQKEYTSDYQTKRLLINIELGIMRLDNLEKYITKQVKLATPNTKKGL